MDIKYCFIVGTRKTAYKTSIIDAFLYKSKIRTTIIINCDLML
ncbi:hypothetical protein [Clostridium cochlearium]|nr:hypothetical protein [Clostridium cochlearium]SNV77190.1 transposase [Clostridium cochlearium]STA92640.1 transposase [Clostridium cochlearium]